MKQPNIMYIAHLVTNVLEIYSKNDIISLKHTSLPILVILEHRQMFLRKETEIRMALLPYLLTLQHLRGGSLQGNLIST